MAGTATRGRRAREGLGCALTCAAAVACSLSAARAHAFSSPLAYRDPPQEGGGGGRYFTGSPADGYGCDVCHEGAEGAPLQVTGLPLDGYQLGVSYEVTITWPIIEHMGFLAEIADETRIGAGAIAMPRFDTMSLDELCSMEEGGFPASEIIRDEAEQRAFVSTVDCGARKTRFQWTAPMTRAGTVWFSAGFVVSNNDAAASGDGVTMLSLPLTQSRTGLGTQEITAGCSVSRSRHGWSDAACLAFLSLCGALHARRRHRSIHEKRKA